MRPNVAQCQDSIRQSSAGELPKPQAFYPFVEGLRAVCALYVVLHHAWVDTWNIFLNQQPGPLLRFLTGWLAFGHEAVTVFIAISGFCLMLPVMPTGMKLKSKGRFFKRRAIRILPTYYAALASSILIILAIGHPEWVSRRSAVEHFLMIHDFGHHMYDINGPMWSIAVECQIYLFFPLLLWITRRASIYMTLLVTGIVGFELYNEYGLWGAGERDFHYLFVFALGMYAAWFCRNGSLAGVRILNVVGLLSSAITVYLLWRWSVGHFGVVDFFIAIAACCLLVNGATTPNGVVSRALTKRPLLGIGAFSYSLYLVHKPTQFVVNEILHHVRITATTAFAIRASFGTLLALAFAYAFYLKFEKPILQRSAKGSMTVKYPARQAA